MPSILESLSDSFGPGVVDDIGKALSADPSAVTKGLGVVGPLLMSGMAKQAAAPGGAESLMKLLPEGTGGLLGSLGGLLGGLTGGAAGGQASPASALLGPGVNAIGGALSRSLGFNVTPLLGMAAPALLGLVSQAVQSKKLDAGGLASMLGQESSAFASNPANKETLALVSSAVASGDKATATIASYGDSWKHVAAGPAAALFMVSTSDLSGPVGSVKEVQAAGKVLLDAAGKADPASVLSAAFGGGLTTDMASQVKALAPTKDKLIDIIKAGAAAVAAKSPAELQAYKSTILQVAQASAEASKEGGFLGIGGTLVSKDEQAALDTIKAALGGTPQL
ncbi:hypothetical protein GCM10027034_27980 [Ramlibacter solisilvae]|uniref:DUF937 domain-containing protein n=1 Tax=Ramlibacter tataouinensis TaxID=94132 RepID=UPI000777FED6|nr:DUF937 domain-containing protein [Ramlibacter tataouinensis]